MAKLPIAPHPIPQASLCSCVPSAASAPTASSSPGPGSRAPPHLRSPGSLPHIHVLAGQREAGGEIRSRSYSKAPGPQLPSQQRGGRGGGGALGKPPNQSCFSNQRHCCGGGGSCRGSLGSGLASWGKSLTLELRGHSWPLTSLSMTSLMTSLSHSFLIWQVEKRITLREKNKKLDG